MYNKKWTRNLKHSKDLIIQSSTNNNSCELYTQSLHKSTYNRHQKRIDGVIYKMFDVVLESITVTKSYDTAPYLETSKQHSNNIILYSRMVMWWLCVIGCNQVTLLWRGHDDISSDPFQKLFQTRERVNRLEHLRLYATERRLSISLHFVFSYANLIIIIVLCIQI